MNILINQNKIGLDKKITKTRNRQKYPNMDTKTKTNKNQTMFKIKDCTNVSRHAEVEVNYQVYY